MIVRNLRLTSIGLDIDRLDLLWEFVNPAQSLAYEVWVMRSGAISGPYSTIAKTYNAISYADKSLAHTQQGHAFYRLKVVKRDTQAVLELTEPVTFEPETDVIAREIKRRNNILLKEFTGKSVLYYPVRGAGNARCPDCWDKLTNQRVKSRCQSCFDTGFLVGYYNPILLPINIHDDQETLVQNAETDELNLRTGTAIITGDFHIQHGDLIVESVNMRWLVSTFDRTEKLRAIVTWHAKLHLLVESDVRYKVPLPTEDVFEKAYKSREYSRLYTLNP